MCEDAIIKLKGIAAILEYMACTKKVDAKYTEEALGLLAEQLYTILEEQEYLLV